MSFFPSDNPYILKSISLFLWSPCILTKQMAVMQTAQIIQALGPASKVWLGGSENAIINVSESVCIFPENTGIQRSVWKVKQHVSVCREVIPHAGTRKSPAGPGETSLKMSQRITSTSLIPFQGIPCFVFTGNLMEEGECYYSQTVSSHVTASHTCDWRKCTQSLWIGLVNVF